MLPGVASPAEPRRARARPCFHGHRFAVGAARPGAFALDMVTSAQVGALASFRLGHVDIEGGFVEQNVPEVQIKAVKTFRTYFMPLDEGALGIVSDWTRELERDHLWGLGDLLFPSTEIGLAVDGGFVPMGLALRRWANSNPVLTFSAKHSLQPGCPITTRTASATCWCGTP